MKENRRFLTKDQKKKFEIWLIKNDKTLRTFAKECGVSVQYLSQITNGKNAITESVEKLFEKHGYTI